MYAITHSQADKGTWYWAVTISRNGLRYHRRFYEPKYGGSAAALQAAIEWRDARLADTPPMSVLEFCQKKRSNNTSGSPGVHFLTPARQPDGIWQARLKLADGTKMTKSFSVRQHGNRKAFKLAVAARKAMLLTVQDRGRTCTTHWQSALRYHRQTEAQQCAEQIRTEPGSRSEDAPPTHIPDCIRSTTASRVVRRIAPVQPTSSPMNEPD